MVATFEFDRRLYENSIRWIESECISADALPAVVGIALREFDEIQSAGVVPIPTYKLYDAGIISPVASLGTTGRALGTYYGIAVVGWLRRASVYRARHGLDRLAPALREWVRGDFRRALREQAETASQFGWARLFEDGRLVPCAFAAAAETLWSEWLDGGWAVCLNQFSGDDVVSKDIETERIPALAARDSQSDALVEAMLRFDRIVRPFAPFERPMSSRCRVIDGIATECGIAWPAVGNAEALSRTIRQEDVLRCA
jgi:hypothetical protein